MSTSFKLDVNVTFDNFDEDLYLAANSDVRLAVNSRVFTNGREHFTKFGFRENRKMRRNASIIEATRREKLERIRPFLRNDLPWQDRRGRPDYLSDELRAATKISDTENVSSNGYDGETLALIERCEQGLVLDCGAGKRDTYFRNVVNYEIVDYDTTDIIGVGECLPFENGTFDAVLSIAVLEHVRDPFLCAREISRVLKPNGELFCSVPFLQPYHGYPHHYFNATHQGIRRLFEDELVVSGVSVPIVGHPAFTLHWFLSAWEQGLRPSEREVFKGLRVQDILDQGPHKLAAAEFGALSLEATQQLACSFVLTAKKPELD